MNDIITNGAEIKQRILSEVNNANQSIYLAMAYFTDRDIAMALVSAKSRNVFVDVILSSNIQNDTVKLILKGANIIIHAFETGDVRGIMHHKFCLIDNKITINGSYNYSINASNNNVENIHVSDDISIYSQFFSEFERLKYNIDNHIAVNEITQSPKPEMQAKELQPINIIDTFSKRLHDLIYSAAQIDTAKYRQQGYENSKESLGNLNIFRVEYENIRELIRAYATDEGLGNIKNVLSSNVSIAYESTKTNLETEKHEKIVIEKRNSELENRQINDKIDLLKQEKAIIESGNHSSGDRGLLQINKEIEKSKLERRSLEQSFVVKKFWTIGTIFVAILLAIFAFYLSIFFASAVYKVFFEGNIIRASLEAGINPGIPQLVDANAIIKIFRQQGILFGLIAALFFLIPILLSNLKILGSENKSVNKLLFLVGLVIFDILVSSMVAINTDEIKCLLVGKDSTLQIWEVVKHMEFWLIFVFGMFPLLLTHFLLDNITNAFKKSQRDLVDGEKNKKIQLIDEEMIDLSAEKDLLTIKLKEKEEAINQENTKAITLETEINNRQNLIENTYSALQNQIKVIYEDYSARITRGKIFTDVIFDSVISAYKSGFIEFLPEFYATEEVAIRVVEIERTNETTIK